MPVATFRSSLEKAMVALERRNDGWTSKPRRGEPAGSVPSWKEVSANSDGRPTITAIRDRAGVPYGLADFIAPATFPPARRIEAGFYYPAETIGVGDTETVHRSLAKDIIIFGEDP